MRGWKKSALILVILAVYFLTRLYGISRMNEYYDYDEGTYLLIARLIMQGYLPYRDIFAVHPPMHYYSLSAWLWLFGDNYIIGRLFPIFLGALSIVVAYYIGKELHNQTLGFLLAAFLTIDPLLVHVNNIIFHETSIELFTLLSLYYFVRYIKSRNMVHAYLALFWVGLGSTFKFTILPYAVALYIIVFLYSNDKIMSSLHRVVYVLLNPRQLQIIVFTYIVMITLVMSTLILWPNTYVRLVFVVPGLHKVAYYDQIVSIMTLLVIWGTVTITVFKISYLRPLKNVIQFGVSHLKQALVLAGSFLFPKILVEGILGVTISRNYIYQTYLVQGNRSFPLINIFGYIGNRIANIYKNSLEFWVFLTPILAIMAVVLILWIFSKRIPLSQIGNEVLILFVISAAVYFVLSPTIINERFALPLFLLIYILLADILVNLSKEVKKERVHLLTFLIILLLLIADFGIIYQYPSGRLKFVYGEHTKTMRDDLKEYLAEYNISLTTVYSLNPMNTYYMNATTVPYYIDAFGLLLFNHFDSGDMYSVELFNTLRNQGVEYFIISTWARLNWASNTLKRELRTFSRCVRENSTLLYGESYPAEEVIELYSTHYFIDKGPFYVNTHQGALTIWFNSARLANVYMTDNGTPLNFRTKVMYEVPSGVYRVVQYNSSKTGSFMLTLNGTRIVVSPSTSTPVVFRFTQPITLICRDAVLRVNKTISSPCELYWNDTKFIITGQNLTIKKILNRTIEIKGRKITLGVGE